MDILIHFLESEAHDEGRINLAAAHLCWVKEKNNCNNNKKKKCDTSVMHAHFVVNFFKKNIYRKIKFLAMENL